MELLDKISDIENLELWRYLDFHRFASLALTKQRAFIRLDKLRDPMEGLKRDFLMQEIMANGIPDDPSQINPNLSEKERIEMVENKRYFESIRKDKIEKSQKSQFVNCWFLGNRESMAMWNLYSTKSGLVIKTDAKEFIDFIGKSLNLHAKCYQTHKTYAGKIIYLKLNPFDPFDFTSIKIISGYKKDLSFNYENEFRFLIEVNKDEIGKTEIISIDLIEIEKFKFDILTHPNIENYQFENIKSLARNSFPSANVIKSKILLKN